MKLVILVGSPRKNGNSAILSRAFISGAEAAGHQVTKFDTAFLNIKPCTACYKCRESGSCIFDDDMQSIEKAMLIADGYVFISPIYYFGMSGQIKIVIDRFFSFNDQLMNKDTPVWLISPFADDITAAKGIESNYEGMLQYFSWQDQGRLLAANCYEPEDLAKTDYEARAYQMGKAAISKHC